MYTLEEQRTIFKDNLNRYLRDSGKTEKEIASSIGVSPQTFNTWTKGKAIPRMPKLQKLADYFQIQINNLVNEDKPKEYNMFEPVPREKLGAIPLDSVFAKKIPLYGDVSCGRGCLADNNRFGWIATNDITDNAFAIKATGNSMTPEIHSGDIVIIEPNYEVFNGMIGLVCIDEDVTLKKIYRESDGIWLKAINKNVYEDTFYSIKECQDLPLIIQGRLVQVIREY